MFDQIDVQQPVSVFLEVCGIDTTAWSQVALQCLQAEQKLPKSIGVHTRHQDRRRKPGPEATPVGKSARPDMCQDVQTKCSCGTWDQVRAMDNG